MRTRRAVTVGATLAFVAMAATAATARADTFMIRGGGRVHGRIVEQYTDEHEQQWLRVKAAFGTIAIPKRLLKKQLKTKGSKGVVHLEEAVVFGLTGTVERSGDGGETWQPLRLVLPEGETTSDHRFPLRLAPGDRVRTGEASSADLDVGYGLIRLAAASEVELLAAAKATISVRSGRAGVRVDEKAEKREFRVETPQASMGVRGTAFIVEVTPERTHVLVGEGVVRVAGADARAGATATVESGGEPVIDTSGITSDDEDFLAALRDGSLFPRIDWVVVKGGTFTMGDDRGPAANTFAHGSPTEVELPAFLISRTEITIAQYDAFRSWVGVHGEATLRPAGSDARVELAPPTQARSDPPLDPREPAEVAWLPAAAFARFAGGRLVSEAEWEWTAFQGEAWEFPWGADRDAIFDHAWVGVNSGDRQFERVELSQMIEAGGDAFAAMREARCRAHPVRTKLPAPSGVFDLIGNVEEWCADLGEDGLDGVPRNGAPRRTGSREFRAARGWGYAAPTGWNGRTRNKGNATTGRRGIRVVVRFDQ